MVAAAAALALTISNPESAIAQNINLAETTPDVAVRYLGYEPNSVPGQILASAGDVNSDGFSDFVIGSPLERWSGNGAAYLVRGKASGFADVDVKTFTTDNTNGYRVTGPGTQVLGYWVAGAGDFNGDGNDDFILGDGDSAVYVVFGGQTLTNLNLGSFGSSNSRGFKVTGFGMRLLGASGAGDINNDGYDDILVADTYYDYSSYLQQVGKVYVLFGRSNGIGNVDLANFVTSDSTGYTIVGGGSDQQLGANMAPIGDFNGDGYADVLVGGYRHVFFRIHADDTISAAAPFLVVLGKATGFADMDLRSYTHLPPDCVLLESNGIAHTAGRMPYPSSPGMTNDFNGDGLSDIVVASPDDNPDNVADAGSAYVVFGQDNGTTHVRLQDMTTPGPAGLRIDGRRAEEIGRCWSWAGDTNNDGRDDVMLQSERASYNGLANSGSTYVVYGKTTLTQTIDFTDNFIAGTDGFRIDGAVADPLMFPVLSSAGDANGDGYDDLLVGRGQYQNNITQAFTWLVFGREAPKSHVIGWDAYTSPAPE